MVEIVTNQSTIGYRKKTKQYARLIQIHTYIFSECDERANERQHEKKGRQFKKKALNVKLTMKLITVMYTRMIHKSVSVYEHGA